jgi:hypothetical protein
LPQGRVFHLAKHDGIEFGEHLLWIESRPLDEEQLGEAVGPVPLLDRPDLLDLDLRAELFVLRESAADLEELARLPLGLAVVEVIRLSSRNLQV